MLDGPVCVHIICNVSESELIVVCPIKVGKVRLPHTGVQDYLYRNTYGETHHSEVFSNDSDTIARLEE